MGDDPKVSPIHLSLLSRSGLKANAGLWWAIRSSVVDKLTHLAFLARVAVCQDFPVELARVQHSLGQTLLQVGNIRINFACLLLARLLGLQDIGRLHGLTDRFAVSSRAPGYLANGYSFAIQVSNHKSLLKC